MTNTPDPRPTVKDMLAESRKIGDRFREMTLSDLELERMVDFLAGYDPQALSESLDFIATTRADAIARAARILEA